MKKIDAEPCPGEMSGSESCFGHVQDHEELVRFIVERKDIIEDPDTGHWKIAPTSFAEDDINGVGKGQQQRSVSTFRLNFTPSSELVERAKNRTIEKNWKQDPVVGVTKTSLIREIVDQVQRRNFCVFADKTEADDPHGVSESHASIRKSSQANPKHQRQGKAILRGQLSDAFQEVKHLVSGSPNISV